MSKRELAGMTVRELRELGGTLELRLGARMKKAELVDEIQRAFRKKRAGRGAKGEASAASARPLPDAGTGAGPGMEMAVEKSKFYTGPDREEAGRLPAELPSEYGDDRIVLMARDPYWAFTYWEVTARRLDAERGALKRDGLDSSLKLRLYDVTGVNFDGTNAHGHSDIDILERVGDWFIDAGRPGRSYVVDLGLMASDGRFVTLARSNPASLPNDGVSSVLDEEWVLGEREFGQIYALSGGLNPGMSSADIMTAAAGRMPFGIASPGMGSLALMSPIKKRERGFWFVLNTELIVYGATEPDAKVSVQGRPVGLRPDGTFTLRFALPDGTQVIPVSATSADEVETRWITPEVKRHTSY